MDAPDSISGKIEWGYWIILVVGILLFLAGAVRFALKQRFGFADALYCCIAIVPAGLFLLISSYVLQHAKLASVVPLFMCGILVFSFPVVDVSLGLTMMGAIAVPALTEWKNKKGHPQSTEMHGGRNAEDG
ncbi:MAG TPA: hypothetical protein VN679_08745 [Candidatus Acidoferrales bacterium]|nr:hypothetical protein [Candidatus Acidoferrales bacterium]